MGTQNINSYEELEMYNGFGFTVYEYSLVYNHCVRWYVYVTHDLDCEWRLPPIPDLGMRHITPETLSTRQAQELIDRLRASQSPDLKTVVDEMNREFDKLIGIGEDNEI